MNETPRKHRRRYRRAQYQPEPEPKPQKPSGLLLVVNHRKDPLILLLGLFLAADCTAQLLLPGAAEGLRAFLKFFFSAVSLPLMAFLLIDLQREYFISFWVKLACCVVLCHAAHCFFLGIPLRPFASGIFFQTSPVWGMALGLLPDSPACRKLSTSARLSLAALLCFLTMAGAGGLAGTALVMLFNHCGTRKRQLPKVMVCALLGMLWGAYAGGIGCALAQLGIPAGFLIAAHWSGRTCESCVPEHGQTLFVKDSALCRLLPLLDPLLLLAGGVLRASVYGPGFSLL